MILVRPPRAHSSLVRALLLVFGCAGFVACSSTTVTTSASDAGASDAASTDATAQDSAALPGSDSGLPDARADSPSGDAAASGECGFHPKQTACTNCCVAAHSDGAGAYLFAVANCMCVDARCQRECAATFCADTPKDPDATCNACISAKTGECSAQIAAECSADADCVAFDRCMGESGCLGKP